MSTWKQQIRQRARLLHNEISAWQAKARELGVDADSTLSRYYEMLDQLYTEDLPLAKAKDESELLLHIEGVAVSRNPKISLVSNIFNNVKFQVRDLAKVISGARKDVRFRADQFDLGLSGIAKGSLFVGFSVATPADGAAERGLLTEDDPLYLATRKALSLINAVSHSVDEEEFLGDDSVREVIDDPKVRDAALVAVKRIAPSGLQGVDRVGVTSASDPRGPAILTPRVRQNLNKFLREPIVTSERLSLVGTIREIDLDARRFELRGIEDPVIDGVRCVYSGVETIDPRSLLDAYVSVSGWVERRADAAPRLMGLDEIRILKKP